jgi:hypothetical protein
VVTCSGSTWVTDLAERRNALGVSSDWGSGRHGQL